MDLAERTRLLARVATFQDLGEAELAQLAGYARSRALAAKEVLFHKGDAGRELYVISSGRLKALTTSREGDEVVLSLMGPGEVVGEISLFAEGRRTATVKALERSQLLMMGRAELLEVVRGQPRLALRLLEVMAARLARITGFVEDTLFLNLPSRLAKKLLELAASHGEPTPAGIRIGIRLSQTELGDLVGTSRESINKQLRAWAEAGIARMEGGRVLLERPEALEELVDGANP